MARILLIMAGGAVGSIARYWVTTVVSRQYEGFPWGTLAVNVVGCLLIGILGYAFTGATGIREDLRLAMIVGILGGFTTFSSFGYDTLKLWMDHQIGKAIANVVLSNVLGLLAVWIGYAGARMLGQWVGR